MSTSKLKMRSANEILRDIEITLKIIEKKVKKGERDSYYDLLKHIQKDVAILHEKGQEYVLLDLLSSDYEVVKIIARETSVRPEVDERNSAKRD